MMYIFGMYPKKKLQRYFLAGLCASLLVAFSSVSAEISVTDDLGNRVQLPKKAERIISLAPHLTEILFEIGAGTRIVGVTEFSNYPDEAKSIRQIGRHDALDLEAIVSLKPDIVFAWATGGTYAYLEKITGMGIPVYISEPRKITDIATTIDRLGVLTGVEPKARLISKHFLSDLENLARKNKGKRKLKVFYQVWNSPLVTVNGEHIISAVLELCGGENIFDELQVLAPHISLESVLLKNPDVIIASGQNGERPEWLKDWQKWSDLNAVKDNNIFHIHPDLMHRDTPRLLQGAEQVCRFLDKARLNRSLERPTDR
ncbi:MAG: cobalamin-binding protein [Gammaproteobacteria bacterium]|nr:cobalamin-binding protein [Gammaproteobacteria bacterium]